ncbi:MAG: proteasome assembly chaperone family protein [Acidimicrobiales bacterium]
MSPDGRPLYRIHQEPTLHRPVLVVGLEGWVDAGLGAATAIASILAADSSDLVATFDGDHFLDQRARRPVVRLVDGVNTEITWPQTQLRASHDADGNDVLYLVGPEPDFHWRGFVDAMVELAQRFGVRLVVGLGAFPAPAPHTRPVRLVATAPPTSSELIDRVGRARGELEVPAGVSSVLEVGFSDAGMDMVTLWARVPHYVAAMAFPQASAALVDGIAAIAGLRFDSSELRRAADASRRQVDEVIASNREHLEMVHKLEQTVDASEGNPLGLETLPSGDELAAELEKFLRDEDH